MVSKTTPWMRKMASKNERVELEMKIMRYRQLVDRTADDGFPRRIRNQIAGLGQKLRETDA